MLTGLELSRMTKHLGFAFLQREMAASDFRAARMLHWGGGFSPQSVATAWPDMFWWCPICCARSWALGYHCGAGGCWALLPLWPGRCQFCGHLSSLPQSHENWQNCSWGAQLRGDDGLGSLAGKNHPVLTDCEVDLHHLWISFIALKKTPFISPTWKKNNKKRKIKAFLRILIALFTGTVSLNAPGWSTGAANRVNCKCIAAIIPAAFTGTQHSLLSEPPVLSPERAAWHPVTCLVMFLIHLFINTRSRGGGGAAGEDGECGRISQPRLVPCSRGADGGGHRLSGLTRGTSAQKEELQPDIKILRSERICWWPAPGPQRK